MSGGNTGCTIGPAARTDGEIVRAGFTEITKMVIATAVRQPTIKRMLNRRFICLIIFPGRQNHKRHFAGQMNKQNCVSEREGTGCVVQVRKFGLSTEVSCVFDRPAGGMCYSYMIQQSR